MTIPKEKVLLEGPTGKPHVSVDEKGTLRHYDAGCTGKGFVVVGVHTAPSGDGAGAAPVVAVVDAAAVKVEPVEAPARWGAGPLQVATKSYRAGYDAIDWKKKAN